ncbi:hypothetical protein BDC45DRAFT_520212 [Circinella umbellata]|nr:hypothetical protein BDC45DRAFT_520212 [Circinella umbellata]
MSVYDRDDYYNSYNRTPVGGAAPPPPPPHQQHQVGSPVMNTPYDNSNMHDVTLHNRPAYPPTPFDEKQQRLSDDEYYSGGKGGSEGAMLGWQNNPRGSMSDMKLTGHYDSDDEDMGPLPQERKRRSCMDKLCCGCCTCFPRWLRYICCILFLIIVALAIAIGIIAATFKMPDVQFNGLGGEPEASLSGSTVMMNFTLDISVDNSNGITFTFEKILAEAFYPNHRDASIGGGELENVQINKNAVTNISFPFNIKVDPSDSGNQAIVTDLMAKCGLTGGQSQQLTIDYDVTPTIRIAGIPISPKISNSANFDCPVSGLSELMGAGDGAVAGGDISSLIPGA